MLSHTFIIASEKYMPRDLEPHKTMKKPSGGFRGCLRMDVQNDIERLFYLNMKRNTTMMDYLESPVYFKIVWIKLW